MRISVKTSFGETSTFEVEPSLSIRNVKILFNVHNKLVKGEWWPPDVQRLFYRVRMLEDKYTLSYYGIHNECILNLVYRVCYGSTPGAPVTPSSSHASHQEEIKILLTCCICYERYKQPKVLPCQHTFCLSCLEMCIRFHIISQSGKLKCPTCRVEHLVPSGGVQALPSNYTIIEILNNSTLLPQHMGSETEQLRSHGGMQILVKTLAGKTTTLNVLPSDSVETIRNKIFDREGIQPAEQILYCDGKPLQNGKTLSFYGVQEGSMVHLAVRCNGGRF
ncbi:hypothetical protein V3C99_007337 [Haemonchus contortus]